jgi:hypothetical protein
LKKIGYTHVPLYYTYKQKNYNKNSIQKIHTKIFVGRLQISTLFFLKIFYKSVSVGWQRQGGKFRVKSEELRVEIW